MGTNTLTARASGQTITPTFFNDFRTALITDHVPRNSSGVPEDIAGSIGQPGLRWDVGYFRALNVNGTTIDLSTFTSELWRNVSGKKASAHNGARVLQPDGTAATVTIKAGGANPDFITVINGVTVIVSSDIAITGLTLAPASNNTALANAAGLADDENSKLIGEIALKTANSSTNVFYDRALPIDTIGSEISSRAGTMQAFNLNNGSTTEVLMGMINTASIDSCMRGIGYNSSFAEQSRIVFSDNDGLTLLMVNYIFLDQNGATTYASVLPPIFSAKTPASPATNQYWFDHTIFGWKRYNGTTWDTVNRHLIGWAICDTSGCKWAHTIPFYWAQTDHFDLQIERLSNTVVQAKRAHCSVGVAGNLFQFNGQPALSWDITTDLVSGFTEASSTMYHLYLDDTGYPRMEPTEPRPRDWRGGRYHPHKPWRWCGTAYNDGSSNILGATAYLQREIFVFDTPNGHGSSAANDLIMRVTTARLITGTSIRWTDSSTLGSYYEVMESGVFRITGNALDNAEGEGLIVIVKDNGTKGTKNVPQDNALDNLIANAATIPTGGWSNNAPYGAVWSGFLEKGTTIWVGTEEGSSLTDFKVSIEKIAYADDSGQLLAA